MFSDPSQPKTLKPKAATTKEEIIGKILPYLTTILIIAAMILFVVIIFAVCPKMESGVWYNSGLF